MRRKSKRIIGALLSDLKRTRRELDELYSVRFRLNYFTRLHSKELSLVDTTLANVLLMVHANPNQEYEIMRSADGIVIQFVSAKAGLLRVREEVLEA